MKYLSQYLVALALAFGAMAVTSIDVSRRDRLRAERVSSRLYAPRAVACRSRRRVLRFLAIPRTL